jgi:hypothetical protein
METIKYKDFIGSVEISNEGDEHTIVDSFSSIPQYHPKIPHTVTFFEKVSSL